MGSILYLFIVMRFLLLFSSFYLMVTNSSSSMQQPLCHDSESSALLQFKQSFLTDEHASYDPSAYSKVSMWKSHGEGSNCCSWDGLSVTGRLVMLSAFSLPVVISMVPSTPAAASSVLFIFKGLTSLTIISITLRSHVELVSFRGWEVSISLILDSLVQSQVH